MEYPALHFSPLLCRVLEEESRMGIGPRRLLYVVELRNATPAEVENLSHVDT